MTAASTPGNEARTVAKAMDVMLCFSPERPAWGVSELARTLGLSKTVAHRLLSTLERKGFVTRNVADRTYSLGSAVLRLGRALLDQGSLVAMSQGPMHELWEALGETVNLSVRVQGQRVCVFQIESQHALRYTLPLGQPLPLYAGATGRLLLSTMSDDEIRRYLASTPLTRRAPNTITDPARLWKEIAGVRQRGYAVSSEEVGPGGAGVSAPVRRPDGTVAALSVFGPTTRIPARRLGEIAALAVRTACRISENLGAPSAATGGARGPARHVVRPNGLAARRR